MAQNGPERHATVGSKHKLETVTERRGEELQRKIEINTRRCSAGDYQSAKRIRLNDSKNSPPVFAEIPVRLS